MDLMTLAAKITLDDSEFVKGVNSAEKAGKGLAGKMSAMTVAVGNIASDLIKKGANAVKEVIGGSIEGYADYQQLIGGVEKIFKLSSNKVSEYAKQSYKTTGMSANQYMETVTSFSASLLQGLKGNTEEAAEYANMAVQDMADNANTYGTDISSIQNAYQGFAKQNYTMLDNLKLGYGGTREEMIRLINDSGILSEKIESMDGITFDQIIKAIHKMQESMQITGTTANEAAHTISGSRNSLKAAWQDMLAAAGGKNDADFYSTLDNFKEAFNTYMENFVPSLVLSIKSSGDIASAIAEAITELPTQLLTNLGEAGLSSGTQIIGAASKVTSWLIKSLRTALHQASLNTQDVADFGAAIGEFIGSGLKELASNPLQLVGDILNVGKAIAEGFVDGLFEGLFGSDAEVQNVVDTLTGELSDAETKATKSGALISYLDSIAEKYGMFAPLTEEWQQAVTDLKNVMPEARQIFSEYGGDIQGAISKLKELNEELRNTAINAALQKALSDAYELLTKQTIEYKTQENRYNRNKYIQDMLVESAVAAIQKEAQRQLDEMPSEDERSNSQKSRANKLANLANGLDANGQFNLSDFGLYELSSILQSSLDLDKILDIEGHERSVDSLVKAYADAGAEMTLAMESMAQISGELDATKQSIQDIQSAVADAATELGGSFDTTSSVIDSGGSAVTSALYSAAEKIASVSFGGGGGGGGFSNPVWDWASNVFNKMFGGQGKATGMDYVPYNGFRAELHRGEMVLTKSESDRYRKGAGTMEVVSAIQNLNNNIQNMQLVVGKRTFGRAVVGYGGNRINGYIGRAESRRASGYGI